jgi:hypothetical protein
MFKISITKNSQLTNQAQFSSMEEAEQWLSRHQEMGSFGQPKQVIQQQVELEPAVVAEDGSIVKEAVVEMQEVELPGYEVEIEDLSAKLEQEKRNAEAQKFLDSTDWKVLRHRDQQDMGLATSLTGEEFQQLLQERQMAREAIIK